MISVKSDPLDPVAYFLHLGRTVAYNNIDWSDLYHILGKVWWQWVMMGKVVLKKGAMVRVMGVL